MIEKSAAFKDGGLIDITFDEGNPPFTYSGNSFNNANAYGPTLGDQPNAAAGIAADAAGENSTARTCTPSRPARTRPGHRRQRQPALPRPGRQRLHRPAAGVHVDHADAGAGQLRAGHRPRRRRAPRPAPAPTRSPAGTPRPTCSTSRSSPTTPARRSPTRSTRPVPVAPARSRRTPSSARSATPARSWPSSPTGSVIDGSFQLVDQAGNPVTPTGAVTSITLSAEGAPGYLAPGQTADPLYDADDATPGGGDTGSVLISPFIKPGTTTSTVLQPLQLAADDGGHLPGQQRPRPRQAAGRHGVRWPGRLGSPRLRRPARAGALRSGRVQQRGAVTEPVDALDHRRRRRVLTRRRVGASWRRSLAARSPSAAGRAAGRGSSTRSIEPTATARCRRSCRRRRSSPTAC